MTVDGRNVLRLAKHLVLGRHGVFGRHGLLLLVTAVLGLTSAAALPAARAQDTGATVWTSAPLCSENDARPETGCVTSSDGDAPAPDWAKWVRATVRVAASAVPAGTTGAGCARLKLNFERTEVCSDTVGTVLGSRVHEDRVDLAAEYIRGGPSVVTVTFDWRAELPGESTASQAGELGPSVATSVVGSPSATSVAQPPSATAAPAATTIAGLPTVAPAPGATTTFYPPGTGLGGVFPTTTPVSGSHPETGDRAYVVAGVALVLIAAGITLAGIRRRRATTSTT